MAKNKEEADRQGLAKSVQNDEQEELAVVPPTKDTVLAIPDEELDEMFGESSLDMSTGLSFNTVGIMRESAQFDLGNKVYESKLTGFVLFKHRAAQRWEVAFDDRKEDDDPRPQCFSIDGFKPAGGPQMQAETCAACKWDRYGSDRKGGKGKDCRNTMRLLFLQDGAVIPVVITAPPTSLSTKGPLQAWLNGVPNDVAAAYNAIGQKTKKQTPIVDYWWAHVELSLEKRDFGTMSASILGVKTLDVVTPKTDPALLRHIYRTMKDTTELYMTEQHSYIESEQPVADDADSPAEEYNPDKEAAGDYDNDDSPI